MNASLRGTIAELGDGFLVDLQGMNASLAGRVISATDSISTGLDDLGLTVSGDIDDLQGWMDAVLKAIAGELAGTNASLRSRIGEMDARNAGFFLSLDAELAIVQQSLVKVESNLSSGDEYIRADIAALSELTSDLNTHTLSELGALLDKIATHISELDDATALRLMALSSNLTAFATQAKLDSDEVDATLEDLEKLDAIITNVSALDASLGQAQTELGKDVEDQGTQSRAGTTMNMVLIVVVLILSFIILVLLVRMRRKEG
jgi:hypothetical protein